MEFVEGKIAEEKVFKGAVFPKTLHPPNYDLKTEKEEEECYYGTAEELMEMIKARKEWLSELLQRHCAILFRGFNISTPEEFGRVVESFGWEEMPYVGVISRIKVADRVHTANELSVDQLIYFHHEMATIKEFPSKIFFFCSQPSPQGGETSILPSHVLVEKMEEIVPEFVAELSEIGFIYRMKTAKEGDFNTLSSKTWKRFLQTEDQTEAEKRAKEVLGYDSVSFHDDGSADLVYGPRNPIRKLQGKRVWFNTINGYGSDEGDANTYFGDGRRLPPTALNAYRKIIDEICVDIKWQKGDLLLVDNLSVQHARRPGEPPRVLLVSVCK